MVARDTELPDGIVLPCVIYYFGRLTISTMKMGDIIFCMVVGVSIGVLVLVPLACTSDQSVIDIPPLELPDKGHPKLDSQLNQLVIAEVQGKAVEFAENHGIELVSGDVRVIVEYLPGQLEAATTASTDAGAKVEASYDNLLQVVVPITSLTALADAPSIRFIRLPQQPLPAMTNEGKSAN